jgi:hypothetical protein
MDGEEVFTYKTLSLDILPSELWIHVFIILRTLDREYVLDMFHSRPDYGRPQVKNYSILQLNLTCKYFHQLVEPILYERMAFCGSTERSLTRARGLAQLILDRVESRGWVQEVLLDRWVPHIAEQPPEVLNSVFGMVSSAFLLLGNVRRLQVNHTQLTFPMYCHVYNLAWLDHFLCWNISIDEQSRASSPTTLPPTNSLQITHLTIYNMHFGAQDAHSIDSIVRLSMSPRLNFLHPSRSVLLQIFELGTRHSFGTLRTLELSERLQEDKLGLFFGFLSECPGLRTLRVSTTQHSVPCSLPPTTCPELQSYHGSYELACILVSGRPLTRIHCSTPRGTGLTQEFLEPLKYGALPLLDLDVSLVRWVENSFCSIANAFPKLRQLRVWYDNMDIMVCSQSMKYTTE